MSSTWTIKTLLDWTADYFQKKEIDTARLDAEILLANLLGMKRLDLYLQFDRPLTDDELKDYKNLIKRRSNDEPIAYIIGEKDFYDQTFKVDSSVLIPRPDTEILIEASLENFTDKNKELSILDIGCGSGILSIILAHQFPQSKILTIDISKEALELAKENAENQKVDHQINFKKHNFLNNDLDFDQKFDLIISNPPYIKKSEIENLDKNVKNFEPELALNGGIDGLDFYKKISKMKNYLKENGKIILEIGFDQKDQVTQLFKNQDFNSIQVKKDLGNHHRCLIISL